VFGYLSRSMARAGADILVSLANDGWFYSSPGPYQHVALAAFRAIETRKPLIRCTNSGVSTVIDRTGRTRVTFSHQGRCTDVSGIMYDTVPVYRPMLTFYARHGDWFLVVCALFVCAATARGVIRARTAGGAALSQ
jgi:apolipoprotein N-acyltransferase